MFFQRLALLLVLTGASISSLAKPPDAEPLATPLVFEPNHGQAASAVRFLLRGNGHSFLLKDREAVLTFANPALTVRMRLVGQNPHAEIVGTGRQKGVTNYFHGNDPSQWLRSVPHFEKVRYNKVYPGIDLIYYGSGRQLEYDFEIQPFVNPSTIQIEFEGVREVSVAPDGDLILTTPSGEIRHRRPVAFQRRGNVNVPVEARFIVRNDRVRFELGRYDRSLPLTIDPKFVWSSFLGGTGNDQGNDIAIDGSGNAYITGFTQTVSTETEPPPVTLQTPIGKGFEGFVTKLDSAGAVVYSTYFGGTPLLGENQLNVDDEAHSLALDATGSVYVTGYTFSSDFPILNGFQTSLRGVQDAYLVKLDTSTGTLQFSTYLGGNQSDRAYGIAVDAVGNAYLAGATLSTNFPVANAFQPIFGAGLRDAFLTKITAAGTIGYSTYLGGLGDEQAFDVALDSSGEVVLTGYTTSINFPLANALIGTYRGGIDDIFITKFNSTGSGLVFSTFWGGGGSDNGVRLAIDSTNTIYVTGLTSSGLDFPLKSPAQLFNAGGHDAFLIKLHADGRDVDFATFIGAEDTEGGTAVAVDNDGFIYVAGFTNSLGFYAINALGAFLRGDRDGFLIKIAPDAGVVVYSTYLGGFGTEGATAIALDASRNVYVTGFTSSGALGFPVGSNAFQSQNAGGQDGFVFRISDDDVKTGVSYTFPLNGGARTSTAGQTSQPVFGYAAVDIDAGLPPTGLAILDLRSLGSLLNEVSLPVPQVSAVGRVYVTTSTSNATALTLVNPNDEQVQVDLYFTGNGQGTNIFRSFPLPAHAQVSAFTYAVPYSLPIDQVGTLTYTATLPVAAIALRSSQTGGTNSYLPIIDPYTANTDPVTIPQFADGGGWSGQVYLVNPTEDIITGEIRFFQPGLPGEPGLPLEVSSDRGTASVFSYSIDPRQSFSITTFGAPTQIIAGHVDIVPTGGAHSPLAFAILNFAASQFLTTTVEGIKAANEFKMYAEISGTYPEELATMPAVALANSSDTPATVTLNLIGFDGTNSGLSSVITLPPKGHFARFLYEIPGFETLPSPYAGILRATTSQPGVTFAGFRTRYNELGQFMITSTGPLKDPLPNLPVLFPHIVDGGGYATQLIIINGTAGGGATGTIRYLDPAGRPLNVAIAPE